MAGELRNDGPVLSLFEGGVRVALNEGAVNIAFTLKDGETRTAVANFALDLPNLVFLARSLMTYAELVQPLLEQPKKVEGASKVIPFGEEGPCPSCGSAKGIAADDDIRRCGSCDYTWRVR